jgi:hypothetical protein
MREKAWRSRKPGLRAHAYSLALTHLFTCFVVCLLRAARAPFSLKCLCCYHSLLLVSTVERLCRARDLPYSNYCDRLFGLVDDVIGELHASCVFELLPCAFTWPLHQYDCR